MQIQNYTILSKLGEGGMATVYLAQDKKFDAEVAIKFLNKEFIHNDHIRKRFLAEAKNMYKMSHPNIIKVTDLIDEGDTVAFVMEHIDGETLKEFLDRKGKLTDDEIRNIFSQMLEAVGYVHEQGLVHRDIKPSNFMIDKKGKVKLLDFGIAKNTDTSSAEYTQTGTGMQMGTPMYMSPEQITETKSVTAQSDIYSLGVVLWQLVTGEKPYNTNTLSNFQLQTKIVNEALSATGSAFDAIIKKATEKDLNNRYLNISTFLSELQIIILDLDKTLINKVEDATILNVNVDNNGKFTSINENSNLVSNEKSTNDISISKKEKENTFDQKSSDREKKIGILALAIILICVIYLVGNPFLGGAEKAEEVTTEDLVVEDTISYIANIEDVGTIYVELTGFSNNKIVGYFQYDMNPITFQLVETYRNEEELIITGYNEKDWEYGRFNFPFFDSKETTVRGSWTYLDGKQHNVTLRKEH